MSSKRSAVEPSECENVAKKVKKKKKEISSTRDFIREVKSPPYARSKKDHCRRLIEAPTKMGFEHITVNARNLIFYFT